MATDVFHVAQQSRWDEEVVERVKGRGGRMKRIYRCHHCQRVFKRSEHCARHERVHTQEKPFPCAFCDRRYARKDLVKRHERTLHAEQYRKAHPEEFGNGKFASAKRNSDSGDEGSTSPGSEFARGGAIFPLTPPTPIADQTAASTTDTFLRCNPGMNLGTNSTTQSIMEYAPLSKQELSPLSPVFNAIAGFNDAFEDGCDASQPYPSMPYAFQLQSPCFEVAPDQPRIEDQIDPQLLQNKASTEFATNRCPSISDETHVLCVQENQHAPATDALATPFRDLAAECSAFLVHNNQPPLHQAGIHNSSESIFHVQREKCSALPHLEYDDFAYQRLCNDARSRIPADDISESLFPPINDLNRFLSGYLDCFHRHFSIIHLSSLDLNETPSPLIFAMCSIGAQYRLARQKAKNLFVLAGTMSSYAIRGGLPIVDGVPRPGPLWIMQTRVLLALGGMFSGKPNVVLRTIENLGLFAIDYRLRKSQLNQARAVQPEWTEWEDWVSWESSKRLLCGMFIVSNLISTTFGISPGYSLTDDLDFEVLDQEKLWNARSAQEWIEIKATQAPTAIPPTIREALAHLIYEKGSLEDLCSYQISGLTMVLISHAINVHIWNLCQINQLSGGFQIDGSSSYSLRDTLISSAQSMLSKCESIIASARGNNDPTSTWTDAEGPLLFNCQGIHLIAHMRLFSDTSSFHRLTLLTDNLDDIASAVRSYTEAPLQRSVSLTKAMTKAYGRLLSTVKIGHLFLRKTAALSWSLEHAVAGWDTALLLTKWVHTLELDSIVTPMTNDESQVLQGLEALLAEVESDYIPSGSLAAAIAHFCSTTLNDVWVWGVTPRMANVLEQLTVAYQNHYRDVMTTGYSV